MGATLVITLREGFEAALLLGIVYAYLDKIGARQHYRYVTVGGVLGVVASVAVGVALTIVSGPLLDLGPDLIAAAVMFVAVAVLTWHGWWMRQHARQIKSDVQRRIDAAQASRRLWIVGLIAFTGVFREGAETVLFMWGVMTQAAADAGWGRVLGAVLGVTTAALLGWAVFKGGRRVSLPRFFAITSVVLLLLAAGLFSAGIGRLQGLGFLPQTATLWDSSSLLSDQSGIGSFLSGLVGYRARPSSLEAVGYVAYLLVAGILLFGNRSSKPGSAAPPASSDGSPGRVQGTAARGAENLLLTN
jgi:high-affinity iron transporter